MGTPFDVSKFRKSVTKSINGLSVGFHDPTDWISTGNFALNYLISGSFTRGVPLGKVTIFAGESGCLPEGAVVKIRLTKKKETQTVTVGQLKELFAEGKYEIEIDTPDGYQRITEWFDKGQMPVVKIGTEHNQTYCAHNHMLQRESGEWVPACELNHGDSVITTNGPEEVILKDMSSMEECYDFTVDHSNHRYYGDGFSSHNSGKSYFASGNIVRHAQAQGIFVVLIDSENALDSTWLHALGVDTSEEKLIKLSMSMIDDVAKTISTFMKDYKEMSEEDRPKVLFVIDSLGMLLTPTDVNQFDAGDMKGDLGRKPKALTALVRNTVNMFGAHNVGLVCTNHTYESQDMFNPDEIISGGRGFIFASSIVIAMKKMKLKEDADGNKTTQVHGIRAGCKVMKTRYSKPFEDIQVKIPYKQGMSPYSGLFDLAEKRGILTKSGNSYLYTTAAGEVLKAFRKKWEKNDNGLLDKLMADMEMSDKMELQEVIVTNAREPADSDPANLSEEVMDDTILQNHESEAKD